MLPNLIVIGAMKSGTTSLHSYLDLHPQISMSHPKELDFFVLEKNWSKGVKWYEAHFAGEARIQGESSPNYTKCHVFAGVAKRMHSLLPEARLIYILRDPIARIVSHYLHNLAADREKRSISEALSDLENNHYVLCSRYYMQLERYLDCFPESSILVITAEDLGRRRRQTLQQVFRFLAVDDSFYSQGFSHVLHRSSDKKRTNRIGWIWSRLPGKRIVKTLVPFPIRLAKAYALLSTSKVKRAVLDEKLKDKLVDHLGSDVDRLKRYTGNDFEGWCL